MDSYLQLESNILIWARNQPQIDAIVVVGSRARQDYSADHLADLDLILYTPSPEVYNSDRTWISNIADFWLAVCDLTGNGDLEWRVFFEGGFKADFVIAHTPKGFPLSNIIKTSPYKPVFERGSRLLFSRSKQVIQTRQPETIQKGLELPLNSDLASTVDHLLIDAFRLAVFLKRNDLWRSHQVLDVSIRSNLLKLTEWHTQSSTSNLVDTWYDGRFIDSWADPNIIANLSEIFATYDVASLQKAFVKAVDLINTLAAETAKQLNYHYPSQGQARTLAWLRDLPIYKKNSGDQK